MEEEDGKRILYYGDDSVHVRYQQLWKLKMTNKKVKLGHRAAGIDREEECGSWSLSLSKEKDPLLVCLQFNVLYSDYATILFTEQQLRQPWRGVDPSTNKMRKGTAFSSAL
ncbi:hypothetical protein HRI_000871900 [Hibiscus trionum]|uniref:Uncharacterized protein n=1 Tax=Hibiscus trionum TaxID=183268 RepID=A0A9W7H893_HIBTR|nr:hypothetical protein HRI_000871900 [Hibiscus trionum]